MSPAVDAATGRLLKVFEAVPPELNPYAGTAVAHLDQWVREQGVVLRPDARKRFNDADFAGFAAVTYPATDEDGLALVACWFAWLFLLDDQLDDGLLGRDPERAGAVLGMMFGVLRGTDAPPDAPALVTSLADLWRRSAASMSPAWRQRFTDHVVAGGMAAGWEADNRVRGVVPGEADYMEKRRHTGAIYVCMDLIEVAGRLDLPHEVHASEDFGEALNASSDVVCWTNDLYSLDKETAMGEKHNLVTVVRHARGLDVPGAIEAVTERIAARLGDFLRAEERALSRWEGHDGVPAYLAGMRSWMRGNLDWSAGTLRYRTADAARYVEAELVGGAGL